MGGKGERERRGVGEGDEEAGRGGVRRRRRWGVEFIEKGGGERRVGEEGEGKGKEVD